MLYRVPIIPRRGNLSDPYEGTRRHDPMLTEIKQARQIPGEPPRRWFADPYFDLIVWEGEAGKIVGFQLCYGKGEDEHALTWHRDRGYLHERVDDGEGRPFRHKGTPLLLRDGRFDAAQVAERFRRQSTGIDATVSSLVYTKLLEYPAAEKGPGP
jgi:hypothetical protein